MEPRTPADRGAGALSAGRQIASAACWSAAPTASVDALRQLEDVRVPVLRGARHEVVLSEPEPLIAVDDVGRTVRLDPGEEESGRTAARGELVGRIRAARIHEGRGPGGANGEVPAPAYASGAGRTTRAGPARSARPLTLG